MWTGSTWSGGYGSIRVGGSLTPAHRFAWQQVYGPIPEGKFIDHACHNPPCVNVEHLRLATISENNSHLSGTQVNNVNSRVRNVYKVKAGFYVRVRKGGEAHYYGLYKTVEEAAPVAERARREVFGDFAGSG